ncbi:hypothetical protein [Chitinophaga fulva]|uniref:hypothetical protein n=1 Tax=Chitinophaga fulva TaxID=2728842 RepID=UPI001980BB19|nr:hypothetical protein [Chitinophaga fulva]
MQTDLEKETVLTHGNKKLTNEGKFEAIRYHFHEIMLALGLDLEDDSLKDTPGRVAISPEHTTIKKEYPCGYSSYVYCNGLQC